MLAGLGAYFLNFLHGKSKNSRLAQAWLSVNKEKLQQNFTIVGMFMSFKLKYQQGCNWSGKFKVREVMNW